MGWSKQLPIVNLDTGVYFWTNDIRCFTPLCFLTQSFAISRTSVLPSLGLDVPSPQGGRCWCRVAVHKVVLARAVQLLAVTGHRRNWPRSLSIPYPSSPCISLISRIFPCFPIFPPARIITTFFAGSLLSEITFSFWEPLFLMQNSKPLFFPIQTVYVQKRSVWSASYVLVLFCISCRFFSAQMLSKFTTNPHQF